MVKGRGSFPSFMPGYPVRPKNIPGQKRDVVCVHGMGFGNLVSGSYLRFR